MIGTRSPGLQDLFLNALRRSKVPVSIFLTKGVRLQGVVAAFDNFSLELRRSAGAQLVYKHAIATIAPVRAPDGFDLPPSLGGDGGGQGIGLQDHFLAAALREAGDMSLYLVNGVMLSGHVSAFDQYCVLLTRSRVPQMVYKHAISTLQPAAVEAPAERSIEEASA